MSCPCVFGADRRGEYVAVLHYDTTVWVEAGALAAGIAAGIGIIRLRVRSWRRRTEEQGSRTTFMFSGNLKDTGLLEALQFLEIGQRQGILHVYSGRRKGYVTFLRGKVIDAFYRNQVGREAVFDMLELREGDFYFEPKEVVQPGIIKDSLLDLTFAWDERREGE